MNIKSTFLNGLIQEEVYVEQPFGFESDTLPRHVFKINKALYEKLSSFFLENGFKSGKMDTTILHKK